MPTALNTNSCNQPADYAGISARITSAANEKGIILKGERTSASDAAVTYLQGLGFTVTVTP